MLFLFLLHFCRFCVGKLNGDKTLFLDFAKDLECVNANWYFLKWKNHMETFHSKVTITLITFSLRIVINEFSRVSWLFWVTILERYKNCLINLELRGIGGRRHFIKEWGLNWVASSKLFLRWWWKSLSMWGIMQIASCE